MIAHMTATQARAAGDPPTAGERIYQTRCAACHGIQGEGTAEHHAEPLSGDRSVDDLVKFIAASMPPQAKEKCSGEEAQQVARYIVDAFYSPAARVRPRGPAFQANRLTGRQYQHAIADLMTSFRGGPVAWDGQRGLEGSYNTREPNGDGRQAIKRLDPVIHFDFGKSSPDPEKINPRDFSILWRGSIFAPATGDYEFIVRCEHSVQLWVNDRVQPLIDQWVKSGDEKEFRATVRLLGGRAYPLNMNFSKAGQGVTKPAEQAAKEEITAASISLAWIPPGRAEEVVPQQYLSPHHAPETLVLETPFPPEDRSTGFERGNSISKEWAQATTSAAVEVADYVVPRLRDLTGGAEPGPEYQSRLREFCRQFAALAFRRPLSDEQRQLYVDRQFASAPDLETAVERVVLLTLKSPRFLYPGLGGAERDGYEAASRLSFALWDAPPDAALLAAAADGKLADRDSLAQQAERMSHDPRCRFKLREFLLAWTKLDQVRDLKKSADAFPQFDAEVARDLRTSFEMLLDEVVADDSCDFRRLWQSDSIYLNGRLSKIYGGDLPPDAPFQQVQLNAQQRAGLLTHPYMMSAFADATDSSPIRRGVFLARSVLGRALLPPPDAVTPLAPSLHPDLNTRQRVELQTKAESCQACHGLINPLGFALENFDAIGRFRTEEKSRPIDSGGQYIRKTGETVKFNGARELGGYLAGSADAHTAIVEKLFLFAIQQSPRTFGQETTEKLRTHFAESQYNMRKLLVEMAIVSALGPSPAAEVAQRSRSEN